jgi:hypothetical protein
MILDTELTRDLPIVLQIDGGMGRVVCSTPAIRRLKERFPERDITVITTCPDVFDRNPSVKKVYGFNSSYLWEDVIRYGEFVYPEPYHDVWYYNQKRHLAESFNFLLNGEMTIDDTPHLYLNKREISWANNFIKERRKDTKDGQGLVGVIQGFGAGANMSNHQCSDNRSCGEFDLVDDSDRSFLMPQLMTLLDTITSKEDILFLNASHIPINHKRVWNDNLTTRQLMSLTHEADFVISIDSFIAHVAKAFNKKCYQFLGSTYRQNVSYTDFMVFQRGGFPRAYTPNRFNGIIEGQNAGAMEFPKDDMISIGEIILKDILGTYKQDAE